MSDVDSVFPKVIAALDSAGITKAALAAALKITPRSLRNKLSGKSPLTLDEAITIRDILTPNSDLESLFKR